MFKSLFKPKDLLEDKDIIKDCKKRVWTLTYNNNLLFKKCCFCFKEQQTPLPQLLFDLCLRCGKLMRNVGDSKCIRPEIRGKSGKIQGYKELHHVFGQYDGTNSVF